ncbi:dihydrolipoamide acetyltransferase family protein [Clostridium sporogenes]|uniref:Dihydrolipoamide acetyltransferase component of pyruvate dehydrogenase complex n=1 Tax=Clostridium sporogenes TaxID=1509 RepID=A0A7U4LMK2_CLOSG|nr:dihydrolipoamide acetyltransferase family protein [Clostridium sporogenes]AVP59211.1 2-oxo acid dehydrogenase subunit E2 [Clostridium botulinum]AKC62412.1 dihydrolipoyllysine-residue acetyltransferase component of pyruvate dehydrogenase complex [Clostridium sporogenes]AKJ89679.1 PdhC [Clostridium sporogenes]EHN15982.1 TPP-dependent acetoin dehydrogenase complex protein [Clostridium sporogenes PA 3679]KCZ69722.1 dihydrolipoyllysine-residue acetyltransferase component of pyruvate dehydrogenas
MGKLEVMPKLGLTMTEGELVKWHKKEGDTIKVGETLFDVTTDKLTNNVEAKADGIVRKILVDEGTVVECLKPVAIIGDKDEDISNLLKESLQDSKKNEVEKEVKESKEEIKDNRKIKKGERIKISPIAKRLAKENDVDIQLLDGTGPEGRIVLKDVKVYIENNKNNIKTSPVAGKMAKDLGVNLEELKKDGRIMKEDILEFSQKSTFAVGEEASERRVKMSTMRKVIASRMSESSKISPTVTYDIEVDMTNLKRLKDQIKNEWKVTYTDLLVKIVSKVLIQYPLVNCSIEGDEMIFRNYVNIGVAVALEEGLVVPVVKYANQKGLKDISIEVKELAQKAKNNGLTEENSTGGTFTITNLGMFGIKSFSPIINQPEVAILGVNMITNTPVVENGEIVIKPLMNLSLTADHRAVDGAVAAQFLKEVKKYMEKPELLIL